MNNEYKMEKWNLFNEDSISNNLLHKDGTVNYYGKVLAPREANRYFDLLLQSILWENDEAVIFGKHIVTRRKVAWYGNSDYLYTYSNTTKQALAWTKERSDLENCRRTCSRDKIQFLFVELISQWK
jgi:hypothetical protein